MIWRMAGQSTTGCGAVPSPHDKAVTIWSEMMMRMTSVGYAVLLALVGIAPASANNGADASTPNADQIILEELRFTFPGSRTSQSLHWRISSDGKGEISTPDSVGYEPTVPHIAAPVYKVAPGVHSFDLGEDGYRTMREFLALVVDGKRDPNSTFLNGNLRCAIERVPGGSSLELAWSGRSSGALSLPTACLNGLGLTYKSQMLQSWHVLAEQMFAKGHPAISVKDQPELVAPKRLSMTEKVIWTQSVTSWQIDANGKGWIEFLQDGSIQGLKPFQSYYVYAGRYNFQLDRPFHQAVLRDLETYLNGSAKPGTCTDEITMSDQPLVEISWVDNKRTHKTYRSDLGCPSFASRMLNVRRVFNELVGSGKVGEAVMLGSATKTRAEDGS
jgi:hypothetical protein